MKTLPNLHVEEGIKNMYFQHYGQNYKLTQYF
jgi:hypothetical protein